MKAILIFIIFCGVCFATLAPLTSPAEAKKEADIVDIYLNREKKNIEVSFHIQNCFTPKMEEAILSGVETTFRILLVMEKKGFLFFRQKLLNIALEHTIKYDRLNNQFHVVLPEHPDKVFTTTDFSEAKKWMSSVDDLPLIPTWRMEREIEYKLRLKAELSKVHLPLFFRYIFYFVSLWDFETGWHSVNFSL